MNEDKVLDCLRSIEKEHQVTVLLAVCYGSRCFGYASADSDWDVRFVYVRRPQWYFSLEKTVDTIEFMDPTEGLDLVGYDIKKAVELLTRTNPTLSDWLHADSFLIVDENFRRDLLSIESMYYSTHRAMHHFFSMGVKQNFSHLVKEACLKRFIYYLRYLLACQWTEQYGTHPPVNIDTLIDATMHDAGPLREKAHALFEFKRSGKAFDDIIVDCDLFHYMRGVHAHVEEYLHHSSGGGPTVDHSSLSRFIMQTVLQTTTDNPTH